MMNGAAAGWLVMFLARWKRLALLLLAVWVLVSYVLISPLRCAGDGGGGGGEGARAAELQERLRAVSEQLDALRAQHSALRSLVGKHSKLSEELSAAGVGMGAAEWEGPSEEYEALRRRLYEHTSELWYLAGHELARALADEDRLNILQQLAASINHRKSVMLADQQRLAEVDGHAAWREREAREVAALVQRRLHHLQHPPDCGRARKIVCNLNKGCGFGCQLHHVAYCLIFAYATERTLVLNSRGWRYNAKGWEAVFRPLSDSCVTYDDKHVAQWPDVDDYALMQTSARKMMKRLVVLQQDMVKVDFKGKDGKQGASFWRARGKAGRAMGRMSALEDEIRRLQAATDTANMTRDAQVVSLPYIDSISQKPKFLPLAIPKDLAHRIVRFNGDPAAWWVGQVVRYILRARTHTQRALNDTIARINYRTPIVGVHVRRTDKVGTEAAFHGVHEYMKHVEQYWVTRDLARAPGAPLTPRRVYLASDDPAVLEDARKKYPNVEFLGDTTIAKTAAMHRRYNPASLHGLLVDLTLLSRADYLVCTFSSQVGRVAYEMMQSNRADASNSAHSLDDLYYFGGQNPHDRRALLAHLPTDGQQLALKEGDLVGVAGNLWSGYGRGTNKRTNVNGLFPWYKTVDHLVLYPFPEYKHVSARDTHTHADTDARTQPPAHPHERDT